jgi:mannose-6-phosphate isomerase-like protein (cupin superfamily)
MVATIFRPGEGENLEIGGSVLSFKATAKSDAPVSIFESRIEPGFPGPPLHVHNELHDIFFIVEGTLTMQVEDEVIEAPAGTFVHVHPKTPHTFANRSDETVRVFSVFGPPGFEDYLRELAELSGHGPPSPETMSEIASRYDFEPVGPPLSG